MKCIMCIIYTDMTVQLCDVYIHTYITNVITERHLFKFKSYSLKLFLTQHNMNILYLLHNPVPYFSTNASQLCYILGQEQVGYSLGQQQVGYIAYVKYRYDIVQVFYNIGQWYFIFMRMKKWRDRSMKLGEKMQNIKILVFLQKNSFSLYNPFFFV